MAWTEITRPQYRRAGLRYASNTTDQDWAVIEPHLPLAAGCGRRRAHGLRTVIVPSSTSRSPAASGAWCRRNFRPTPYTTIQRYFYAWRDNGLWLTINHVLLMAVCEAAGREASPTAGVIDSRSVKTAESGGSRGYPAEKMIKGRKRHLLTDTIGLPVGMILHPANVQDRDGAPLLLESARHRYPWLRHVFADGGYAGNKLKDGLSGEGDWTIETADSSSGANTQAGPSGLGWWDGRSETQADGF